MRISDWSSDVCSSDLLVVLGRHVPQFAFLDVLLGSEPVLSPQESLYQRLLAGDPDEATEKAEDYLEERPLIDVYEEVAIPALGLMEHDRARGVLDHERRAVMRSEEHTPKLQSLMRIQYTALCLKKKKIRR